MASIWTTREIEDEREKKEGKECEREERGEGGAASNGRRSSLASACAGEVGQDLASGGAVASAGGRRHLRGADPAQLLSLAIPSSPAQREMSSCQLQPFSTPSLFAQTFLCFANSGYLRERITRWIDDDDERTNAKGETGVQYVVLAMSAVGSMDTSRKSMLDELKKTLDRRAIQIVLANPGSEIMKKLDSSKVLDLIGHEWIFLTVGEAVAECDFVLHSHKPGMVVGSAACENMV